MAPGAIVHNQDVSFEDDETQQNGVTHGDLSPCSRYTINEAPLGTRRPIRIVCMGAGYSGLMMGIIVSERMQRDNVDFVIYDRNDDLGGTWLENKYPGCQCDIPAHNYAYSFEPNPDWPNYYAKAPQIYEYMKNTSKKYDVDRYMKFRHEIINALWDEVRET